MTIQRVFLILFALQLVSLGAHHTTDPDMWWHLRTGELIWTEGIPQFDTLSLTVTGDVWITHEWLCDALIWAIYAVGGLELLSVVFAFFSGLAFWLAYRCSAGQPYLAALPTLLAASAAAASFGVRPQVLNMLLMAVFVFVVEGVRNRRLARSALWLLPVATIVWANLHSGYLLGVAVLMTYAAGEGIEAFFARRDGGIDLDLPRRLILVAVACQAAALLNPNGWHIWLFPIGTLGSDVIQQSIVEWGSPDFHQPMYWPFAALLGLGVFAWAVSPRRPPVPDLLLFFGTAAAGLNSRRHIALFAIASIPVICRALTEAIRQTSAYSVLCEPPQRELSSTRARLNWMILAIGILGTVSYRVSTLAGNDNAIATEFPVAAVNHLEQTNLARGRGYNSYGWGGYLIWRGLPVFIDGRAEVYGDFLGEYLQTDKLSRNWRRPLDRFEVDYVITERHAPLATLLDAVDDWRLEYSDDVARIFVRRDGSNHDADHEPEPQPDDR